MASTARAYRQTARAAAAEDTRRRIVEAFAALLLDRWLDEITVEDIAAAASVTRQTVIRIFGAKEGLLLPFAQWLEVTELSRRRLPPGSAPEAILRVLVAAYETDGDRIVRLLAQEPRYPALTPLLDWGRRGHRAWVAEVFASHLAACPESGRAALHDQLVAATDVYAWKLFRRDMGHGVARATALMTEMTARILTGNPT